MSAGSPIKTYEPLPQYVKLKSTNIWRLTCSGCGGKQSGWGYHPERSMWVCGTCHRPSYIGNVEECDSCNQYYVIAKKPDNDYLCRECNE